MLHITLLSKIGNFRILRYDENLFQTRQCTACDFDSIQSANSCFTNITNRVFLKYPKSRSSRLTGTVEIPKFFISRRTQTAFLLETALWQTHSASHFQTSLEQQTLPTALLQTNDFTAKHHSLQLVLPRRHLFSVIRRWGEDLSRGSIWWPSRDLLGHRSSTCTSAKRYSNSVINIVSRCRKGCVVAVRVKGWRGSVVLNAKHPSQHNSTATSFPGFSQLCLPFPYKHVHRFKRLCDFQSDLFLSGEVLFLALLIDW